MSTILDERGNKLATIDEEGRVHNGAFEVIGTVRQDSHVYNSEGSVVGYFDAEGRVYKGSSHVGDVHADGRVFDYENRWIGKISGDHIESGGAALLLLVR